MQMTAGATTVDTRSLPADKSEIKTALLDALAVTSRFSPRKDHLKSASLDLARFQEGGGDTVRLGVTAADFRESRTDGEKLDEFFAAFDSGQGWLAKTLKEQDKLMEELSTQGH